MKHLVLLLAGAVAATTALGAAPAAKGDPARGAPVATSVCAACHGPDGNSPDPANPKLAGQHADYLFKQMKNFKALGDHAPERANPIMNGMIAPYDEAQMRDLAAYFAAQRQKPETAANGESIALGQKLYRAGDQARGLAACAACHGPAGAGLPAQFPRVQGQYAAYLEAQLKAFRDGARANDPAGMMRMVAIKMSDAEIKAVAGYVAGLR